MVLKIAEDGEIYDVPIREGEVFFLPAHVRHAPQRPMEGSIGLVVESPRQEGMKDAFEWFCFNCKQRVHRIEVELGGASGIVEKLPKVFAAFHEDEEARTCPNCGELHQGMGKPPAGWVTL
jgi:3-hydroxyanthranilate 3,4-dioxygenase